MRFGFISTRFSGTDGVSLESSKWADVLCRGGHEVFWFSGLSDRPEEASQVIPQAHFEHPAIVQINKAVWGSDSVETEIEIQVATIRHQLKLEILSFIETSEIDILVPQNALTIPMNIPLGLAIRDAIEESGIRALAHHHDFYWERDRFTGNAAQSWLIEAFPPILPTLRHVVINQAARRDLKTRVGLSSSVIPNVMDFSATAGEPDGYADDLREAIGLAPDDRLILQPTRIVPRKGIELSIELLSRLNDSRNKLVISHDSGDEGHTYLAELKAIAERSNVELKHIGHLISSERFIDPHGRKKYTLQDLYPVADLVTFPSLYEGFGNALLEAVHFGKPTLVNRYSVFKEDIEPAGFQFITIDGRITDEAIEKTKRWLNTPPNPEINREIAQKYFGYDLLQSRLSEVLAGWCKL